MKPQVQLLAQLMDPGVSGGRSREPFDGDSAAQSSAAQSSAIQSSADQYSTGDDLSRATEPPSSPCVVRLVGEGSTPVRSELAGENEPRIWRTRIRRTRLGRARGRSVRSASEKLSSEESSSGRSGLLQGLGRLVLGGSRPTSPPGEWE